MGMLRVMRKRGNSVALARTALCLSMVVLIAAAVSSCSNVSEKPATETTSQRAFANPEEAGATFLEAVKSGDQAALLVIFGPDGKAALFSGDPVKDKDNFQDFVVAYTQMHRWREIKEMLYIGADNYPFPIPVAKNAAGQWAFVTPQQVKMKFLLGGLAKMN
jgi:hypothetical protein